MRAYPKYRCGFTILELSIVLVIIGMIIGSITVAQHMIRTSQLQSITKDVTTYQSAVKTFRDKYSALPGDFAGAEALWGSDTSCPSTPYTASPHIKTCNGNGDGQIGSQYGTNSGSTTYDYESLRAWQHLSNAGLIDGTYTGTIGSGSFSMSSAIGVNIPASKVEGAGYSLTAVFLPTGDANNWPHTLPTYHVFRFGGVATTAVGSDAVQPIITPMEAAALDSKQDDGIPSTGTIQSYKSTTNPSCTTSDTLASAQYASSNSAPYCSLNFLMDF